MTARGARLAQFLRVSSHLPGTKHFTRVHAWLYIRTGGRLGRRWFGSSVLVLETTGRRSGKRRRKPLIYILDGETPVLLAANAGHPRTPSWWLNLRDEGRGVLYLGPARRLVTPRLVEGAERERLWRQFTQEAASVAHYTSFTERRFPLVALEPAVGGEAEVGTGRAGS